MSDQNRSGGTGDGGKPVIRVQRRRPSTPSDPAGRERAEAPRRDAAGGQGATARTSSGTNLPGEDQGAAGPAPSRTSTSGGPSAPPQWQPTAPSGGSRPALSGRTMLVLGVLALVLLCVCGIAYLLLGDTGRDQETTPTPAAAQAPSPVPHTPTATARPTIATTGSAAGRTPTGAAAGIAPTRVAAGKTWLVMLYDDADDKILEQDICVDLNEAERVGSSDSVRIVAQLDRFAGGYTGDGNWTSTRRYYVTQDDDLQRIGSQLVADLGEKNMADPNTLIDFVTWAMQTYPADKYALILSDHGMGWPGGWSDPAPATRGDSSTPLSAAAGNQLYLMQLDAALQTIRERTGLDKFELIGMDACLMGQIEVLSALAPHARYAVTSEETEPALGWAYASFLEALQRNPGVTGAELGKLIVGSYIQDDQRIVDDQARADMLQRGSPMGGLFGASEPASADAVARQMGRDVTLAAVDLSALPALVESLNALAFALQKADQSQVARARSYAQSFTSVFGRQVPASYIDLGNLVQLLQQTKAGEPVNRAAEAVTAALGRAVLAEKHGSGKPGASGISIYFPNSQLYGSPEAGPVSYTAIARRFADSSLWDDYLAFHYTGRAFEASAKRAVVPPSGAAVSAPGAGTIQLTAIKASGKVAAPGRPVLLSTDISGPRLGYVLLFAGFLDRASNSIFVADMDYLESADTRQAGGVYYPVWPQGAFTIEFEWEPLMFAISDGRSSVTALLTPAAYGATPEEATYTVEGTYTYASGEARRARLYFRNGSLRQVFGFTGADAASAPREIHPQAGDTFTVLETWLDLDAQGRVTKQASQTGDTLTFGAQMFTWKELDAAAGEYVVGFIAKDLDGNSKQVYTNVTVR